MSLSDKKSEDSEDEFEDAVSDGFEFSDASSVETKSIPLYEEPVIESVPSKIITANRRTSIPPRLDAKLNLWNLIKNFVGQDLTKIPLPVNFNEPLSMIQRYAEGIEYYNLLDKAASCTDSAEQMLYIAAFSISCYSTTRFRINKPFNPLLGETFELDRWHEKEGFRMIIEQTSHHPPAASMYCESKRGWVFWSHTTITSKFRGNFIAVKPVGLQHIYFKESGEHYTFDKITTTAHNIIVGKLWVDNSGEQVIINHKSGDICKVKFHAYSYFSKEPPRRVSGTVFSKWKTKDQKARYATLSKTKNFNNFLKTEYFLNLSSYKWRLGPKTELQRNNWWI